MNSLAVLEQRADYLGANKDWMDAIKRMSDRTGDVHGEAWIRNASENRELVKERGWITEMQDAYDGKTAILMGASAAIKKQFGQLRAIQGDPDFVSIGLTSGIKMLIENGIRPDYCMMMDADVRQERFWEGLDMGKTKDTTLIASVTAPNVLLKRWKGPIKFLAVMAEYKNAEKKFAKWFRPVNGCGLFFHALFSQYNTAAAIAFLIFRTSILIFVGNELSFPSGDAPYYADRSDEKDRWVRGLHPDIHGKVVHTSHMLMSLKLALEDYLGKLPGWFLNCTEAGIFGVTARYGTVPWILNMKLGVGIAQARSIMRTGKPIYL